MTYWRYIDYCKYDASYNMAVDEAVATSIMDGTSPPTLRLYGWLKPSVSIGAFQKIKDINIDLCKQMNIRIVRRLTGGRAILHDKELTYSFSTKTSNGIFSDSLLQNYRIISSAFWYALRNLGTHAIMSKRRIKKNALSGNPICFQSTSYGEITVHGKKIIGSAQKRYRKGLLQQGSIPLSIDRHLLSRVFNTADITDSLAGLNEISAQITQKSLSVAVREAFETVFHVQLIHGCLSASEKQMTEELAKKYRLEDWTFRR